jgi:hypothetical protein
MSDASLYDSPDFETFWTHYLALHSQPSTRWIHALGTASAGVVAIAALATGRPWLLCVAPLVDYALAQLSHRLIEGNRTQPYRHPVWHVRAELRLFRHTVSSLVTHGS